MLDDPRNCLFTGIALMLLTCVRVVTLIIVICSQYSLLADERADRVQAGKVFLSKTRLQQWESLFTEGVREFGLIRVTKDGKVVTEAWFEKEYMLRRRFEKKNRVITFVSNPDYLAEIRTRGSEKRIYGVHPSASNSAFVYVEAMPFAVNSSVNFKREMIPSYLLEKKLSLHDYRSNANRHIVELEYTEEAEKGLIELIFDDDVSHLLPVETTFGKGTPYARHFISSDFRQVAGYMIPYKVEEMNDAHDVVTTEFFPEDRLDPAMCRLSYYGLPEPGELNVSDFGRRQIPWLTISLIVLASIVVAFVSYILTRKRLA